MSTSLVVPVFYLRRGANADIDFRVVSADNDTVAAVPVSNVVPADEIVINTIDIAGATAKVWLNAALAVEGTDYLVTVHIVTTLGRCEVAQITVKVRA